MQQTSPLVVSSAAELRAEIAAARRRGLRVGLVPTMGALHEGHLSLVDAARAETDLVVVSIFVNPTQFGPQEDFTRYPRQLDRDLQALGGRGANLVFTPTTESMYGPRHATMVEPAGVALRWEGAHRPGHFRGVATIVLKLFQLVQADVAFFGRKDLQQCLVIAQMARDFDLPIELRFCPIVREADGLALSSRNAYLAPAERQRALVLSRSLRLAAERVAAGETDAERLLESMHELFAAEPQVQLDYLALADPETLEPLVRITGPTAALVAARVGTTRLIDNWLLEPPR